MFENVTYDFYADTLGRSAIPSEDIFNSYKLQEEAYMKTLLPYVSEREENGIDSAVCLMIEEDYKASLNKTDSGEKISSFSLDGYSQNMDVTDVKSIEEKKMQWLKIFCYIDAGVI